MYNCTYLLLGPIRLVAQGKSNTIFYVLTYFKSTIKKIHFLLF